MWTDFFSCKLIQLVNKLVDKQLMEKEKEKECVYGAVWGEFMAEEGG